MRSTTPTWPLGRFPIAMGTMALTGIYGRVDRRVALATIHHALDIGFDHFDTAELYGPYRNEELLAGALTGRHGVTVATKVGYRIQDGKPAGLDSRPSALRLAVEGSLGRLGREQIDLVYQHRQDPDVPVAEAVGCLGDLVREGKIRHIGLSHVDAIVLARARSEHAIMAVQNEVSFLTGPPSSDLRAEAAVGRTVILGHSPLGRGLLAGMEYGPASDDFRSKDERFSVEGRRRLSAVIAPLRAMADSHGIPLAAAALAWVRANGVLPVVGPKSPAHLDVASTAVDDALWPTGYLVPAASD